MDAQTTIESARRRAESARRRVAFEHWLAGAWSENTGAPGSPASFYAGWEAATIEATAAAEAEVRALREGLEAIKDDATNPLIPEEERLTLILDELARVLAPEPPDAAPAPAGGA